MSRAVCPICQREIDPLKVFELDECPECERPLRDIFDAAIRESDPYEA